MRMRQWAAVATVMALGWAGAQTCGGTEGLPSGVKPGVFRGTVGGLPVALHLNPAGESGYFYERRNLDLWLEVRRSGATLILEETVRRALAEPAVVTGCFALTPTAGGLQGTWRAPGKAALLVRLTRADLSKVPLNLPSSPGLLALRAEDPLAFLKLNRAWVKSADGRSVREPLSRLTYPRLPGASAGLNAALQDRQLKHAAAALACRAALPEDLQITEGYDFGAAVTLQGARLVSVQESVSYYCGGAYPDAYTEGLILDRATGQPVPVSAIWPKLTPARQKVLHLKALNSRLDPECLEVLQGAGPSFTAHLTATGLALTPSGLPHVVAACAETATLPYATLRAEANMASVYAQSLYAR
ncbi:hypothetical protein [Deinococcus arboris]|uniref:hypothetical protein n=1 Tax=Deinococcus arboris TaxID=2682977 RepID=UPI001E597686|nr:hypothetical protein [Deinococcus arboris]